MSMKKYLVSLIVLVGLLAAFFVVQNDVKASDPEAGLAGYTVEFCKAGMFGIKSKCVEKTALPSYNPGFRCASIPKYYDKNGEGWRCNDNAGGASFDIEYDEIKIVNPDGSNLHLEVEYVHNENAGYAYGQSSSYDLPEGKTSPGINARYKNTLIVKLY